MSLPGGFQGLRQTRNLFFEYTKAVAPFSRRLDRCDREVAGSLSKATFEHPRGVSGGDASFGEQAIDRTAGGLETYAFRVR